MAEVVRMPKLSLTMTVGRIEEWLKQEGDAVRSGEAIASIESDKTLFELEATQDGILRRVLVQAGDEVQVEGPLAIIALANEDIADLLQSTPKSVVPVAQTPGQIEFATPSSDIPSNSRRPASPAARRVAKEMGVDLAKVLGTGDGGMVTEKDIRAFLAKGTAETASEETADVLPLVGIRRRMAERMTLSRQTAADVTTITEVDMNEVAAQRRLTSLSYTAYVTWAVSRALRDYRILNASLVGDRILLHKDIHLGVAVAMDDALVVPVLRHADQKNPEEIGKEIDSLAALARERKLMPDALAGSTFTISNSGAFGSLMFTPIINQPEVAILGMGKVADTPVVRNGEIVARKLMYLCLSYDHRVVEGASAVKFLQVVKRRLEQIDEYKD